MNFQKSVGTLLSKETKHFVKGIFFQNVGEQELHVHRGSKITYLFIYICIHYRDGTGSRTRHSIHKSRRK